MTAFINFDVSHPMDREAIQAHIEHSLGLGLLEADRGPNLGLKIVANGPSAALASLDGWNTLALNGAMKLFTDRGTAPDYWAACDPLEVVASFLPDNPPEETIYLVGSKCHPSVFEKLKGRDVRLWHIDDYEIPPGYNKIHTAVSITLTIMPLMRRAFNYRAFDVYGWDACFSEDPQGVRHHASDEAISAYPAEMTEVCVGATQAEDGSLSGGRWFKTTPVWMAEAQDAVTQLRFADYSVSIHGDGLIKAITGR